MKITGNNPYARVEAARNRGPRAKDGGSDPPSASPNKGVSTEVQISDGAAALRDLRSPESPDTDRVQRLKQAVEDGTFEVDPQRIADGILRDER